MFCFSSYLSAFSHAIEQVGLEPKPFRPRCAESEGSLGEQIPENGACCRFCRATKIDAGNIREQHCLQCNPARLFWKLAYVFIAYIPRKAANQCQYEQSKQGGALTSRSGSGRDRDFSSRSIRTCSIDPPPRCRATGKKARGGRTWYTSDLHCLLACSSCLGLIQSQKKTSVTWVLPRWDACGEPMLLSWMFPCDDI